MKLTHIRLLVRDFDVCLAFYRDTLGFPVTISAEHAKFAELDASGVMLELYDRAAMAEVVGASSPAEERGGDRVVLSVRVEGIDEAFDALLAKGMAFDVQPTEREAWGARTAYFRDPDGNLLELFQHEHTHPHKESE